jgi:hypothetical protein
MNLRWGVGIAASALIALTACTGGKETNAAEEQLPKKNPIAATSTNGQGQQTASGVDATKELKEISRAIPIYAGAQFREDLTKRDQVMIRNQYGPNARVFTMATDDSYPQVYHYYTTYLAQFRAYPPTNPYPPEQQNWRTMEVQLNQAMQDPFIPGDTLKPTGSQVTLQVAETEAEPKTVIRYILTPPAAAPAPPAAGR